MFGAWRSRGGPSRLLRLIALGTLAAAAVMGLMLLPDLLRFLPWWIKGHPVQWTAAVILAGYCLARIARRSTEGDTGPAHWLGRAMDTVETASGALLRRWLLVGLAAASAVALMTWLPHYLYWPFSRDPDTYAEMAQEWDSGVRPYRDIRAFNFPGHIYLHWMLGKLFGWSHTGLFYALDAAALLLLGAVVIAWSRRRLGFTLPGAVACFNFLAYYLGLSFENVAERDWHSPLCATLGLLLLETWPGRASRWLAALLAAVGFTIRPNIVLFLPALFLAAMSRAASPNVSPAGGNGVTLRRSLAAALEWACVFGVLVIVGFAPLLVSGLVGDLIRGLAILRRGGPYSDATTARSVRIMLEELSQPRIFALAAGLLWLAIRSRDRDLRVMARAWLLALAGALAYRPIHPLDHAYLRTPLTLVCAVAWAIPLAAIIRAATRKEGVRLAPFPAALAVLLVVYESMPEIIPGNCSLGASLDSVRAAVRGRWPESPPGSQRSYGPLQGHYAWDDYCRLLAYLRDETGPTTIVANVLKQLPFPSANGAAGRRSPFRVESGVAWMYVVAEDLDEQFARELDRQGCDSVVVWSPAETDVRLRPPLKRLTEVIVDRYAPEARFGSIEVWRRKCPASVDHHLATAPAASWLDTPPDLSPRLRAHEHSRRKRAR